MKKQRLFLLTLFMTILLWGVGGSKATAASYSIDRYRINVNVEKNGDANVTQRIKYRFDGLYHGVFLKQDYAGTGGIAGKPSVTILSDGDKTVASQHNSGAPDTFETSTSGKVYQIKVYHVASDENVTYIYKYRLKHVVVNYADTAELNWKIIGSGWEVPLNHVQITVQLPGKNVKQLQAWTHGPLSGHTKVNKAEGKVTMTVAKVPAKTFVESHLVFPTALTSANSRISSKYHLAVARKQEAQLAKQANRKRVRSQLIPLAVIIVALGFGLWYLRKTLRWFNNHVGLPVKPTPKVHSFEIPPYSAVTSQSLLTESEPDTKAFTAWIMELAANGELTIQSVDYQSGARESSTTYRITETPKISVDHQTDELLTSLFDKVGKGEKPNRTFTIKNIDDYSRTHPDSLSLKNRFEDWQETRYQETDKLGLFNHQTDDVAIQGWLLIVINLALGIAGAVAAMFLIIPVLRIIGLMISVIFMVVSIILAVKHMRHVSHYTQEGEDAAGQIRNFRRMLHDIGEFDRSQVGDLILWEQMLPYAVAFGLAKRVLKAMTANFSAAELTPFFQNYYPMYLVGGFNGVDFGTAFTTAFTDASIGSTDSSSDFSSGIGGSGGFSGGSSGGFGGGSGGGAF